MKTLSQEQIELLKKPLDPKAIGKHPTKSYLSTIKAIYVVERFNEVFGLEGWTLTDEIVENNDHVVVKVSFTAPEYGITKQAYGGNQNSDRGDSYKGAVTDAITKIGSYLYVGMDVFKGLDENASKALPPLPQGTFDTKTPQTGVYEQSGHTESQVKPRNYAIRDQGKGVCEHCGTFKALNPKTGKIFCQAMCWLKRNQEKQEPGYDNKYDVMEPKERMAEPEEVPF